MNDDAEKRGHIRIGSEPRASRPSTAQIPLRLMILAEFAPAGPGDSPGEPARISIDKNSFGNAMKRLRPRLSFDAPNRLAKTPKEIAVALTFDDIKSFRPEALVRQVGPLGTLMSFRDLVTELIDRKISREEFQTRAAGLADDSDLVRKLRAMLAAAGPAAAKPSPPPSGTAPTKPAGDKDSVDALFDMVEVEGDESAKAQTPLAALESLIAAVARPKAAEEPVDKAAADATITAIDRSIGAQINEILHNGKFQRLESTWRGLKLLVDRADFRENIRVEILNVAKDELRDVVYEHVFRPEYDGLTEESVSVIVIEHSFDRSPKDIELLQDLGRMGESIRVPFIGSVAAGFFGLKSLGTLPGLPSLADKFSQSEYAKWNGFRNAEQSRWVALTVNRMLLRPSYGAEGISVKGFNFEEEGPSGKPRPYLWGSGVWALAAALAASFAETGWCVDISGPKSLGAIGDLPVRQYKVHGGDKTNIPLEILLPDQKGSELADAGLMPIVCRPNDDMACVASVRTAHRPRRYDDPEVTRESALHATLPYQLFAGRMSQYLQKIHGEIGGGADKKQVEDAFKSGMLSALSAGGERASDEAVQIEVTDSGESPDYYDVTLRIRPPFNILGQSADLLLGLPLRK